MSEGIRDEILAELKAFPDYETTEMESRVYNREVVKEQVFEELNYHIKSNKASPLLIEQLMELYGNGYVTILGKKHPYETDDIFSSIDSLLKRNMKQKPFIKQDSVLSGRNIFHIHHSASFYIKYNLISYFEGKYRNDEAINEKMRELKETYPDKENIRQIFINCIKLDSVNRRKKSGQWLIYQKKENYYYFICLYLHDKSDVNDRMLYNSIKDYLL